jgi:hypothetical protein
MAKNREENATEGFAKLGHTQNEPSEGVGASERVTQPVNLTRLAAWLFSINWLFAEPNVVNSG